jgi:hypothetical protein
VPDQCWITDAFSTEEVGLAQQVVGRVVEILGGEGGNVDRGEARIMTINAV